MLTAAAKNEMSNAVESGADARKAEMAAMLFFAGGLRIAGGRLVIDAEVDSQGVAMRIVSQVNDLCGCTPIVREVGGGARVRSRYLVRVIGEAETVARQIGLVDARGRLSRRLPADVVSGTTAVDVAIWRGAFLARGSLSVFGHSRGLEVECPGIEAASTLAEISRRFGVRVRSRHARGADRVTIRDTDAVARLLDLFGAPQTRAAWQAYKRPDEQCSNVFDANTALMETNMRRAVQSGAVTAVRARRALEILGERVPDQLAQAACLRIVYPSLSLGQLGRLAQPRLTKDAVAGRLRRLLAMADSAAAWAKIADTNAAAQADHSAVPMTGSRGGRQMRTGQPL